LIIGVVLNELLKPCGALHARVPGMPEAVETAGSSYVGWSVSVQQTAQRKFFLWEELFQGVKKAREPDPSKMSLEECIRVLNSMCCGGDLRATVNRKLPVGDQKTSILAGCQYAALGEYLAGDTKGALERFNFYLSDISKAQSTDQAYRPGLRRCKV
jgi:hypothetical protein